MRKVDKMQKRGKHISKYFERPEGTQEDVAEMDGLRNCACSFLQHEPLSMGENVLAASDVTRLFSGHRRYLLSTRNSELTCERLKGGANESNTP